jgi:uncharacterized protein (TIGR02996 family)
MTTLDDLLQAVLADSADDGARLAYADCCEEEGQTERAEFVRVQVALAVETRTTYQVRLKRRLKQMCRGVVTLRRWTWTNYVLDGLGWGLSINGWPFCVVPVVPHATFRRGFVESVTCSCVNWLAHGPTIVAAQPVTAVRLADRQPYPPAGLRPSGRCFWSHSAILEPIFLLLEGYGNNGASPLRVRWYDTREAAHASLSAACVRWARAAAGLPPCPLL